MKRLRQRFRLVMLGACVAMMGGLCQVAPTAAQEKADDKTATREQEFARQVLELTNRERARYKLAPLVMQQNLTEAAHWMARDMAQNSYFAHIDHQGRDIAKRFGDFGYNDWHTIGENIAGGQRTPAAVVEGWMRSPGHRRNILNGGFHEIGIGYYIAPDSKLKRYWVQDFGARF